MEAVLGTEMTVTCRLDGWKLGVPMPEELDLDAVNVAIALGLCLVVSMLFGLLPAIRFSRPTLLPALKDDVAFCLQRDLFSTVLEMDKEGAVLHSAGST